MRRIEQLGVDRPRDQFIINGQREIQHDWHRLLRADPTDWLLEPTNPSVRYWTLVDIVGKPSNDPMVEDAARRIGHSHLVLYIMGRRNRKGLWGNEKDYYTPKHVSTFWALSVLGDLGVNPEQLDLSTPIDYMLSHQQPDGSFPRREITTGAAEEQPAPCTQARILRFLAQFGYAGHPSVRAGFEWLAHNQRSDGTWICADNVDAPHGCLRATHDFVRLAALLPAYHDHKATLAAGNWMMEHLLDRRVGRFKVANLWGALTFPTFDYNVLSATEALTGLGYAVSHQRMAEVRSYILERQLENGAWQMEVEPKKPPANFGQKGQPNKWVTLEALRVLKRMHGPNGK